MFGLYYLIKLFLKVYIQNNSKYYHPGIDNKTIEVYLEQKFAYYQKLDEVEKARFVKRTKNFIRIKEFHPAGGLVLTEEMIILISASAIQLTFGLTEYLLLHFSRIFVYPKEYYSKYDKLYHKGETNLAGAIVLSWNNFMEGYNKPNDNINLGLHEMAHALRFDKFKSESYDTFFSEYFEKWLIISKDEFLRLKNHNSSFFRNYGGVNVNEFFSVCVEYFFESPREFSEAQPEMYKHLCILLNQDPLTNHLIQTISEWENDTSKNDPILEGPVIYKSTAITPKNMLALTFAVGCWILLFIRSINGGDNQLAVLLTIILPVVGYFVFNSGFKKIYFYSNGIQIKYLLPNLQKLHCIYNYSEIILIEFEEGLSKYHIDSFEVRLLDERKIKTLLFSAYFNEEEVKDLAHILIKKKVGVKVS
jgi:Mlc titration factor MtfA (ptsG expression regulator)